MRQRIRIAALLALCGFVLVAAAPALAQTDTANVPQPPAAKLAKLAQFFGKYRHSNSYWVGAGPFAGTLEVRPAVKGWYVEWIIDTRYGPIDREFRMLVTFDAELARYRYWSFDTTPPSSPGTIEGKAYFEGDTLVTVREGQVGPHGERGPVRTRWWMEGRDVLVLRTDAEPEGGKPVTLGLWRNRRIPAEAGASGKNLR